MSISRRCLDCGVLGQWDRTGRCDTCKPAARKDSARRRATKAARYDANHRRLRKRWLPFVLQGIVRCGRASTGECLHADPFIRPGESWDLDHLPAGRSHPSHADCNRAARRNVRSAS